jgi:hypothetical protein
MAQPDLTTVGKVKDVLRDPVGPRDEIILQDLVTTASRMIRQITGRRLTSPRATGITREFPTYDTSTVYVDEVFSEDDITSVTDENGVSLVYEADWDDDGGIVKGVELTVSQLDLVDAYGIRGLPPDHGELFTTELRGYYGGLRYPKKVRVSGNFGYAAGTLPGEVEFAARQAVAVWFREEVARYTADAFISRGQVFEPEALPAIALSKLRATGWIIEESVVMF